MKRVALLDPREFIHSDEHRSMYFAWVKSTLEAQGIKFKQVPDRHPLYTLTSEDLMNEILPVSEFINHFDGTMSVTQEDPQ